MEVSGVWLAAFNTTVLPVAIASGTIQPHGIIAGKSLCALHIVKAVAGKTILFGLTGTGYFDMVAYEKFHNGEMTDYIPTDAELEASFATLPKVPGQD